jgi:hypothetical protein
MERLDDMDNIIGIDKGEEISRANALSQSATTFIKSVNVGMRVIEMSNKYEVEKNKLTKELGINDEK